MFRKITYELTGIKSRLETICSHLRKLTEAIEKAGAGTADSERLSSLEGRMEAVLGQVEAGILKVTTLKGTALAAEDRARGHLKRAENALELARGIEGSEEIDSFEAAGRAYQAVAGVGDDEADSGVPALYESLENGSPGVERAKAAKRR